MADSIRATPQNKILGQLADVLRAAREKGDALGPELTKAASALRFALPSAYMWAMESKPGTFLLNQAPEEVQNWSYGNAPVTVPEMTRVPQFKKGRADSFTDLAFAAQPMAEVGAAALKRGALAAAKAGERYAEKVVPKIMEKGGPVAGLLEDMAQGSRSQVYRKTTPLKPDPEVGTRFQREYVGGLADKTPVKLEDYQGSSLLLMPWDSTSRNYKITGISDEVLPRPVITHGGQDYARDLRHIEQGVGGASNLAIAKRIRDRDAQARIENIAAGGTGEVLHLPVTMGYGAENFSVMPTEALLSLVDLRGLPKKDIKAINNSLRDFTVAKGTGAARKVTQPFKGFAGIDTEEGRIQLLRGGEGVSSAAGELRKALVDRLTLKENQAKLGFNAEDLRAALMDPALANVPKGYAGNTVLLTDPSGMRLRPSSNPTYNTDFTAQYQGSLGLNVPAEVLFPDRFTELNLEFAGKSADPRNMALGALEKRGAGVSQFVNQQLIDNYYKHVDDQLKKSQYLLD
jgi:hypothetical protein